MDEPDSIFFPMYVLYSTSIDTQTNIPFHHLILYCIEGGGSKVIYVWRERGENDSFAWDHFYLYVPLSTMEIISKWAYLWLAYHQAGLKQDCIIRSD